MRGEILKAQLLKIEPTLTEVARKLDMSKQNLDAKLSTTDVKTGFIEQLSVIYKKPISFFFSEAEPSTYQSAGNVSGHNVCGVNVNGRDIDIKCPTEYEALLNIVNANNEIVSRMQAQLDKAQSQIDELIALLKTKL